MIEGIGKYGFCGETEEIEQSIECQNGMPLRDSSPIPFLRPSLPCAQTLLPYLEEIDRTHIYSNFGPLNQRFESRVMAGYFENQGAIVTVSNATIGLMTAIRMCLRPGARYALMPSFTFAATPLAAMWCGLEPYFIEIRPDDWCVDEQILAQTLHELGDQVAVVIPYACFSMAMNLDFYADLHRRGIPVVIDAAASFGVETGDGQFGLGFPGALVYSLHATKSFGIGEGGLVYSSDAAFISRVRQAINFGFGDNRSCEQFGLNGKLSEYAAAVALAVLDSYPDRCRMRRQIEDWYLAAFASHGLTDSGWKTQRRDGQVPLQFMPIATPERISNAAAVEGLAQAGIQVRTYFAPACHQQAQFASYPRTPLPVTEELARTILSLPVWEGMTPDHIERIVRELAAL